MDQRSIAKATWFFKILTRVNSKISTLVYGFVFSIN